MPSRYRRYRDGLYDRMYDLSPEEFNRLPEHQQRRVLREKYLRKQWEEANRLRTGLTGNEQIGSLQSLAYWAVRNFDRLGWRSILGMVAFVFGLYKTIVR